MIVSLDLHLGDTIAKVNLKSKVPDQLMTEIENLSASNEIQEVNNDPIYNFESDSYLRVNLKVDSFSLDYIPLLTQS